MRVLGVCPEALSGGTFDELPMRHSDTMFACAITLCMHDMLYDVPCSLKSQFSKKLTQPASSVIDATNVIAHALAHVPGIESIEHVCFVVSADLGQLVAKARVVRLIDLAQPH